MTDLGPLDNLSRVELEPILWRAVCVGDQADVAAVRAELAARTWQNINPYADAG